MKICFTCKREKHNTEFYNCDNNKTGLYSSCKECVDKRLKNKKRIFKQRIFEILGDKCICCGESRKEFLTVDHINGRKRRSDTGHRLYQRIIARYRRGRDISDFRVLCLNCNCSIGFYGYCPHERERKVVEQTRQIINSGSQSQSLAESARESTIW